MITATVELRELREKYTVSPGRADLKPGDDVLIATRNGLETGLVTELAEREKTGDILDMKVIRQLNEEDYRILEENSALAEKMLPEIRRAVKDEGLKMNLTKVSYTYDRQKLFVYYTAPDRVDFRNLIRKLGARLKIRVQMVQIGVRDEASIKGSMGICGRIICCHLFRKSLGSVNIDMARNQQLSLNPESISGCCGRLLCCLKFENSHYEEAGRSLPQVGKRVVTPEGKGDIVSVNCLKNSVFVKLQKSGTVTEFKASDISGGVKGKLKKWIK